MIRLEEQIRGLSAAEVQERLDRGEHNQHLIRPTRTYWQIISANVFSLYNIILLGSFLALLVLRGPGSSIFPAAIVLINMVLGLVQEIRAKRALDQLALLSVRTITVRRDGRSTTVRLDNIVRDDVIELQPGDSIVVDGRVLASDSLEIDESQLTGESEYIPKQPGDQVTSGSFCVSGAGLMQADSLGNRSYVGALAEVARRYKNVRTPLEAQLDALVEILVVVMLLLAPLTLLGGGLRGMPLADSVENVVNLISSLVPQGLLVFVAISFAYGVINISRYRALIQRPNAVELMGHISCLCADKTGTLTENLLTVRRLVPVGGMDLPALQSKLALYASAVSWQNRTVAAIASHVGRLAKMPAKLAEVPFNSQRQWSSVELASGETLVLGAPEVLLADATMQSEARSLSGQGLRVLAFATSARRGTTDAYALPPDRNCIGLIALQDEVRPDMPETLRLFAALGIAIKIISGDSPETVKAIADSAGFNADILLTGPEVANMGTELLSEAVKRTSLFARVSPEVKRRIVRALAAGGPVAMIGDGVNDVPALKEASLAIAMNSGAQIAKDVSDIVLLDNAFATLPRAFREGQEITRRLYAIAKIHLTKVVYLTILFVLAGYAGLPWPANLLQTTWLSLLTLTLPAMLIIFRVLPTPVAENRRGEVLRYLLVWGTVGAGALVVLDLSILIALRESLAVSRSAVIAFAGLYNSLLLWDIYGIKLSSLRSFLLHKRAAVSGAVFGLAAVVVPAYLLPRQLGLAPLRPLDLALIALLLCLSYIAARFIMLRLQK